MVKLIIGNEGTGKTLRLLDLANNAIKDANGHLVYLDKSTRHMYEINNKVRLIDVSEFNFSSIDEFYGFVCGIISQDRDIEQLYFDSFKKLGKFDISEVGAVLDKFDKLSEKCGITFNMAMSVDEADIPDSYKDSILK
ncbi:MAG: twitching motility protein PilT [Lachnospiraceae bacterium]|nr:twitching motility protein PilT [Lachnospiraceae bacterium]MBR4543170.1 twitching motility protein PilT [Lachnospiraceae bacterium]